MAVNFLTPDEIAKQYLLHLKGLKPEVNIDQTDSDWWVKGQAIGGLMSGVYADQRKIADDAFPQNARHDALERHIDLYFGGGFNPATQSTGEVGVTGTIGSTIPQFTEFLHQQTGNTYQATEDTPLPDAISLTQASGVVSVLSVGAGQDQNLLEGSALVISSPPIGINAAAVAVTDISDGRNAESDDEARQRILDRVRFPLAGGTVTDYKQWARDADPSVVETNVIRFIYGPGTVGVVITAGTTDIDDAVNRGIPVIREPSQALVDKVQNYINAKNPLTDCAFVFGPQPVNQDVTVRVRYVDGDNDTVPAGQTLTQREMVQREVRRAIYKTPPGGRQLGGQGYLVCSEIEEVIDLNLSAEPYTEGEIAQILADRQVDDLAASGPNRRLLPSQMAEPGTITVIEMS